MAKNDGQSARARALLTKEKSKEKVNWREDKIDIKIHKTEEMPDRVFVGINGVSFSIESGVWVLVPKALFEILENAKTETKAYTPDPLIPNQYAINEVTIPRFAVSTRPVKPAGLSLES